MAACVCWIECRKVLLKRKVIVEIYSWWNDEWIILRNLPNIFIIAAENLRWRRRERLHYAWLDYIWILNPFDVLNYIEVSHANFYAHDATRTADEYCFSRMSHIFIWFGVFLFLILFILPIGWIYIIWTRERWQSEWTKCETGSGVGVCATVFTFASASVFFSFADVKSIAQSTVEISKLYVNIFFSISLSFCSPLSLATSSCLFQFFSFPNIETFPIRRQRCLHSRRRRWRCTRSEHIGNVTDNRNAIKYIWFEFLSYSSLLTKTMILSHSGC